MISLRHFMNLRRFSTSTILRRPQLSSNYTSSKLWEERFDCKLLAGDEKIIRAINSKITLGADLNNLELDIFINVATPRVDDISQLQESVKLVNKFRKTLYAHTLLPSTPHALCRLFLESERLPSLVHLLEDRVKYGLFPDFFIMNLMFDKALEKEEYALASRLAALVMLQEEFGINQITDVLSLYSTASYIESRTGFELWKSGLPEKDPVLTGDFDSDQVDTKDKASEETENKGKEAEAEEEEDDEEDAEYIRVPFLRNPYHDNHFDLTNPRVICGKTLSMLGNTFSKVDPKLATASSLLGELLQGKWPRLIATMDKCIKSKLEMSLHKDLLQFYVENLHDIEGPNEEQKTALLSRLGNLTKTGQSLSQIAELKFKDLDEHQNEDIRQLKESFSLWSNLRLASLEAEKKRETRRQLEKEIQAKKEELKRKEQYLYFFDNLRKSRITKIDYN